MSKDIKHIKRCTEIINVMMGKDAMTLPEITTLVNISLPIVTNVVNDLVNSGELIQLPDLDKQQAGRPAALFKINPEAAYTIGAELGRIYSNFVVLDYSQNKIFEYHTNSILDNNADKTISALKRNIENILTETGISKNLLLGIGIAIPGIVQGDKGISQTYMVVKDKPLNKYLEEKLGVKVRIEHDVKSMALGEYYYGFAQNVKNALYINYGWGLGAGIIMNGKLYYGNDRFAGEFGHIPLSPNGELCYCGKQGCLETISSGRAITKKVNKQLAEGASSILLKSKELTELVDPNEIIKAANKGDQFSIEILEEAGRYLGIGIAILINLFNPGHIIIGGTISQVAVYVLDSLKNNALKHSIVQLNKNVVFKISELKNNAASLGVARLTSIENCYKD